MWVLPYARPGGTLPAYAAFLTAFLLPACAPEPLADARPGPTGLEAITARLDAEARAFRVDGGGLRAASPRMYARLDASGLVAARPGGGEVSLRFAAWGRESAVASVGAAEPFLGACNPDEVDPMGVCVRRAERTFDGVTEWWVSRRDGIEQGWDLEAPPDGQGAITLVVEVEGAEVRRDGAGGTGADLVLTDLDGGTWSYGGLAAWDADGDALPVDARVVDGAIVLTVDDTGARWPLTVDPLLTPADPIAGGGSAYSTGMGETVVAADVNGDGYDDVVTTALNYGGVIDMVDYDNYGAVYVFPGSAAGVSATAFSRVDGIGTAGSLGSALGAADVNGDGYDDVIVTGTSAADRDLPAVYVYHGSGDGLTATVQASYTTTSTTNEFGGHVAGLGDVNGDGYEDVVITTSAGNALSVYHGSATGLGSTAARALTGSSSFATAAGPAGDVNADGYDDLVVTCPNSVRTYVYHGSASGIGATAATTLSWGDTYSDRQDPPEPGDYDGDTYGDLAIAVSGYVQVYYGGATGISSSGPTRLTDTSLFGIAMASGDTNRDGYDDLAVWDSGEIAIFRGAAAGISTARSLVTEPASVTGTLFGRGLAAGDFDRDGYADLAISQEDESAVYLYEGGAAGVDNAHDVVLLGDLASNLGASVALLGDVDGDGYGDVAASAPYADTVLVYLGTAAGIPDTAAIVLTETSHGTQFGTVVRAAGDVNGDGYADLLATSFDEVLVYHGGPAGFASTPDAVLAGSMYYGYAADGIGDVDGDGYDDIALGDWSYTSNTGRVWIHHGSASGVESSASRTLTGSAVSNQFGLYVSGAGDVNADGYADLLIGERTAAALGTLFVFHGSAAGIGATAAVTISAPTPGCSNPLVSAAGDVNGDGYDDVMAVSTTGCGLYYYGGIVIYPGSASGVSTTALSSFLREPVEDDALGYAVAAVGDVDGDGFGEVAIIRQLGVNVYGGSAAGLSTTDLTAYDLDGIYTVARMGADGGKDINADGALDLVVGTSHGHPGGGFQVFLGYADLDGDGYPVGDDCDDRDATINPVGLELCDAADVDEDCDGLADSADPDATGSFTFYVDADGDGFGDPSGTVEACDPPAGYAADATDCDDTDPAANPGATEVCDGAAVDEDCDGLVDDLDADVTGAFTWYGDGDGDGYGDPVGSSRVDLQACKLEYSIVSPK